MRQSTTEGDCYKMHDAGPYGAGNPTVSCMENGQCKKEFPKSFSDATVPNLNGYPVYRWRPDEQA
jgi:hypothetical protein